jgi:hypothetical protein
VTAKIVEPETGSMDVNFLFIGSAWKASWNCGKLAYVDLHGMSWDLRMSTNAGTERAIGGKSDRFLESLSVTVLQGLD